MLFRLIQNDYNVCHIRHNPYTSHFKRHTPTDCMSRLHIQHCTYTFFHTAVHQQPQTSAGLPNFSVLNSEDFVIVQDTVPPTREEAASNLAILKSVQDAGSQASTDEVSEGETEANGKPPLKRSKRIRLATKK